MVCKPAFSSQLIVNLRLMVVSYIFTSTKLLHMFRDSIHHIVLIRRVLYFLSIGLFLVAITQPTYCTDGVGCSTSFAGLAILISGAVGFFACASGFTWLANPILFYSWYKRNTNHQASLVASILSTVLACSFLFFKKVIVNEGGEENDITVYQLGYWLWLASSVSMLIGNLIMWFHNRKSIPISMER
jgi:hypothetical protein